MARVLDNYFKIGLKQTGRSSHPETLSITSESNRSSIVTDSSHATRVVNSSGFLHAGFRLRSSEESSIGYCELRCCDVIYLF